MSLSKWLFQTRQKLLNFSPRQTALFFIAALTLIAIAIAIFPPIHTKVQVEHFLPLHVLLEFISIVISMLIFTIGWNAYGYHLPLNILFLSTIFFGVGILDFSHVLSYAGMPNYITPNSVEKGINFWLAGRYMAAIGIFIFVILPLKVCTFSMARYLYLGATLIITALIHWLFLYHGDLMPATFIPDQGLTPFKNGAEYLLILINAMSAIILWRRMAQALPYHATSLLIALCILALGEFFFTLYSHVTDIYNVIGHIYKSLGYLFIYHAIFVSTVQKPYKDLDEKNRIFDSIIDNIPHMIFLKDAAELRYKYFNKAGELLIGQSRHNMIGRNDYDFFPKDQADFFALKDRETLKHKEILDIPEEEIKTPRGIRFLHTKKIIITDNNGAPEFLLGISEDITDARLATQALIKSEQSLVESQTIAQIGSYDLNFETLTWTSSYALKEIFGITESYDHSIAGWENLIHPDDRAMMSAYFRDDVIAKGAPFHHEYRIIRFNDQETRWVNGLGSVHYAKDGSLLNMIGTIQDITETKKMNETLVNLSLAVEQTPSSIIITDIDGNIEYVNAMFTTITGYTRDEVIGENPRILQSTQTPQSVYDEMWATLTSGQTWRGELINRKKDQSVYLESAIITPVKEPNGKIKNYVAIKENITEKREIQEHVHYLAHFDQLTGLPNRVLLNDRIDYMIRHAQRNGEHITVMFMDIDRFKDINDTLGHSIGDKILIETAKNLVSAVREQDTVARLGGDEFILLFPNTDASGALLIASKLLHAVSAPTVIGENTLVVTPSIGIAIYPEDGEDFETLLKNSDTAMYRVKHDSRNSFNFFTEDMQSGSNRKLLLVNALRTALEQNELHLRYQPQVAMHDGSIIGAEALIRWNHPELGLISPAEFIPLAEESGQIIKIGEWILRTAIAQMKEWKERGLPKMIIAVNISAIQFKQENFAELVIQIMNEVQLPHDYLELELTEGITMDNPQRAISIMNKLHAQGIRMSIDDFGTGYSSLSYLKQFKIYKLKIDQSFIRDISSDSDDRAIVSAIIDMAHSLGLQSIAEGVETAEQLSYLRLHGCDEIQGYYFSKPILPEAFAQFVKNSPSF